ncbi:MAG TPA: hypothetical protein VJP80_01820 [Candidatus Saccharimonadales bacterium]|nr:hypothetical protein [Candidatus Saccharimonadales bacterium]
MSRFYGERIPEHVTAREQLARALGMEGQPQQDFLGSQVPSLGVALRQIEILNREEPIVEITADSGDRCCYIVGSQPTLLVPKPEWLLEQQANAEYTPQHARADFDDSEVSPYAKYFELSSARWENLIGFAEQPGFSETDLTDNHITFRPLVPDYNEQTGRREFREQYFVTRLGGRCVEILLSPEEAAAGIAVADLEEQRRFLDAAASTIVDPRRLTGEYEYL